MGQQQANQYQGDRDERSGEELARRPEPDDNAELPDSAMGTGNDDPIDNWATPVASGSTDVSPGSTVTSGNTDNTDEIGAPSDISDASGAKEEGYNSEEPHRRGTVGRATDVSQEPKNSE